MGNQERLREWRWSKISWSFLEKRKEKKYGKGHLLGGKVIYSVSDPRFTTLPTAGSSG